MKKYGFSAAVYTAGCWCTSGTLQEWVSSYAIVLDSMTVLLDCRLSAAADDLMYDRAL